MKSPTAAVILFFVSVISMLVVGGLLQAADLQFGLIGSELLTILLPAVLVGVWMTRDPDRPNALALRRLGFGAAGIGWIIVTSALLGLAANMVTGLLAEVVPGWQELAKAYETMFRALMFPDDPVRRMAAIFAVVVVAPLCEETLFRGVMLPLQRHGIGNVAILVVLNGAMFSLIHMNPLSFVALLVVGAFFAHVALLSGSLWPSIIAHATLNFVNGVVAPHFIEGSAAASEPTAMTYAIAALVFVPLTAVFWYVGARRFSAKDAPDA